MEITSENFRKEVLNSEVPVLVDFWASWCNPCKMMIPIVEEIAGEMEGKIKVFKLNVDEERNLAIKYNIMSIPAFLLFKDGKVEKQTIGMQSKEDLINFLNS
jgi:thioredoxin